MRLVTNFCLLVFLSATALADPLALWEAAKKHDWDAFERIAAEMRQKSETCSVLFRPTDEADNIYALLRNDGTLSDTQKRLLISLCPPVAKLILEEAQTPKRVSRLIDLLSTTTRQETPEREKPKCFVLTGNGYETRYQKFRNTVRTFAVASSCAGMANHLVPSSDFEDLSPHQVSVRLKRLSETEVALRGPSEYANNLKELSELCDGIMAWNLFPTISFSLNEADMGELPLWEVRAMMANRHFWVKIEKRENLGFKVLATLIQRYGFLNCPSPYEFGASIIRFMREEPVVFVNVVKQPQGATARSILFALAQLFPRDLIVAARAEPALVPILHVKNGDEHTLLSELVKSTPLALLSLLRAHPALLVEHDSALRLALATMWTPTWEAHFENSVECVPQLLLIRSNTGKWPLIALAQRDPAAVLDLVGCFISDAPFVEALAKRDDETGDTALHVFTRVAGASALKELEVLVIAHNDLARAMSVKNSKHDTPLSFLAIHRPAADRDSLIDLLRRQPILLPALRARSTDPVYGGLETLVAKELERFLLSRNEKQLEEMMPFVELLFKSGMEPDFGFLKFLILEKGQVPAQIRARLISLLSKSPLEPLYRKSQIHELCRLHAFAVQDALLEAPALIEIIGQDNRDYQGDGPMVALYRTIAIEKDQPIAFLKMAVSFAALAETDPKQFAQFFNAGRLQQKAGDTLLHAIARTKGRAIAAHLAHSPKNMDAAIRILSFKNARGTSALSLVAADWPHNEDPRVLVPLLRAGADPYLEVHGRRLIDWIMTSPDLTDEQRRELLHASAIGQSGRPIDLANELARERALSHFKATHLQAVLFMFVLTTFTVSRLH